MYPGKPGPSYHEPSWTEVALDVGGVIVMFIGLILMFYYLMN
jgi:hypothetical protein